MQSIRFAALAGVLLSISGCMPQDPNWRPVIFQSDTLIHGPFLIGAERPSATGQGVCCRPGSIRSQDAKSFWTPCQAEVLGCGVSPIGSRADIQGGLELDTHQARRYEPTSAPGRSRPRRAAAPLSAWDD